MINIAELGFKNFGIQTENILSFNKKTKNYEYEIIFFKKSNSYSLTQFNNSIGTSKVIFEKIKLDDITLENIISSFSCF